ncbi:MAG: type II toxin-antitoxin system MqsR family toxin [Magnetococcales bacterium]|nr:type II toxin-antitoxin system MqsR family toxin [Magnetococcales bacterium]
MESLKPHYKLKSIKAAFKSVWTLNRTRSSVQGARALGFSDADVIEVIQRLGANNFHKSMTSHLKTAIWQDVYNTV